MADEISRPKIVLEVDHKKAIAAFIETGEASKDLGAAVEALGKQFSSHSESSKKSEASIKRLMDTISGQGATAKFNELAEAVNRLGGVEKLTAGQTEVLAKQMERLKSAGGQVPQSLAGVTKGAGDTNQALALTKAAGTEATSAMEGLAGQMGPLGSVMSSLGPVGIAVAAGLAVLTVGVAKLGSTLAESSSAAIEHGSRITDLSMRLDFSTTTIQKFDYAAKLVGSSVESMARAARSLDQALVATPEKFQALGLSAQQLKGLAPEEQFKEVALALSQVEDRTERNVLAGQLLGKTWRETAAILKAMGEGAGEAAERRGIVMDPEVVANLDAVDDAITGLSETWDHFWMNIGAAIVASPQLASAIELIADMLGVVSKKVQEVGPSIAELGGKLAEAFMDGLAILGDLKDLFPSLQAAGVVAATQIKNAFASLKAEVESIAQTLSDLRAMIGKTEMPEVTKKAHDRQVRDKMETPDQIVSQLPGSAEQAALDKRVADNLKKLKDDAKEAEKALEKLNDRRRELAGVKLASELQSDLKVIKDIGGVAKVAADQLDKLAKKYAGPDALPFLMEKVRRGNAAELERTTGLLRAPETVDTLKPVAGMQAALSHLEDTNKRIVRQAEAANPFKQHKEEIKKANTETKNWSQTLQDVANAAQFLGPEFSKIAGLIAAGGNALAGLKPAKGKDFGSLFDKKNIGNTLTSAMGGLSAAKGIFDQEDVFGGALSGAGMGAQFGVWGAAIGAAAGAALGLAGKMIKSESEKIAEDVGRDFGVKISEELAKSIEKDAKGGRGRFDAALLHLGEMIGEAGGIGKFGGGKAAGALRDLFSAVDRGTVSLEEAGAVFDDTFGDVAASQVSKTTGIASAQLRELVLLAKDFGLESEALREFMKGQATGLATNLAGGLGAMKASREKGAVGGLASQGAATALSGAVAADFAAMREAGMSLAEALQAIAPSVTAMREELTAAGLQGTAAFASLESQIAITTGEVTGPLVTGIGSFTGALVNMHNMNMLTAADFAGITEQIGVNIAALEQQGVVGTEAARALQPDLQKIWELQQSTGYAVDATTQALIDQAVEAGIVGEQHRSAADKMAEASERTAKAVEFLASRFGYLADEMNKVPAEKNIRVNTDYTTSGTPPDTSGGYVVPMTSMEGYRTGTGGFVDFGTQTPAFLHGLEAVVTPDDFSRITSTSMLAGAQMLAQAATPPPTYGAGGSSSGAMAISASASGARASSASGAIVININGANKDPKLIADEVAYVLTRGESPALLDEIRKRAGA